MRRRAAPRGVPWLARGGRLEGFRRLPVLSRPITLAALLLLSAACLGLRFTGLDHGLPHRMEPDAEIVTQVEVLRGEHRQLNPLRAGNYGTYPLLIAELTTLLFDPPPPLEPGARPTLGEHLARAADDFLDTRRTVALFSVLIVPATFLLARLFLPRGWSLFAAALTGFSLLDQNFSQQARSHGLLAPMVCLTMVAAVRLRRRGDLGSYLLAAGFGALALGCLHSAVALWPALLAAHLLRGGGPRNWFAPRAWLAAAILLGAIPLFYPFVFEGTQNTEVGMPRLAGSSLWLGNHEIDFALFDGAGFRTVARSLWFYEPVLGLLLVVALGAWLLGRFGGAASESTLAREDRWVLLAYALPYLLVIGLFRETFERFLIPLLPFFAAFAAWGVREAIGRSGSLVVRRVLVTACCLLLVVPAGASARLGRLRSRPDTVREAARWMTANLEPGAEPIFLSPVPSAHRSDSSMELPLLRRREDLDQARGVRMGLYDIWATYQLHLDPAQVPPPLWPIRWLVSRAKDVAIPPGADRIEYFEEHPRAFFATSGPGLFVIEVYEQRVENPTHIYLRRALQQYGTLLQRFSPDPPEHDTRFPFLYQDRFEDGGDWPNYTARCFTARTTGPVVEIYRVEAAALER